MVDLMNGWVQQLRQMQNIVRIYWDDDSEDCSAPKSWCVVFEDAEGRAFRIGGSICPHDPDEEYKFMFLNIILHRVFSENGIQCPYWFPCNIKRPVGLVNDARNLLKLKELGRITEFEFKYVLHDLRHEKWSETHLFRRRKRNYINPSGR